GDQLPGRTSDAGDAGPGERRVRDGAAEALARGRRDVLKEGDPAPDIELPTETGETMRLSDLRGKRVVLYFYPKANTPGCTTESCEFRDDVKAFAKKGATVVGISPDKPAAQMKFKQKYDLPFTLLADHDKKAAQAFGVWKEKNLYGL